MIAPEQADKGERPLSLSFLVPIYNETAEAIRRTIEDLLPICDSLGGKTEIIVIDDGSNPECAWWINAVCLENPGITLLRNPYNLGYGASLKRGIRTAGGEYILITDSDGSYPAESIPLLLEKLGDYDMVVGSRSGKNVEIQKMRGPIRELIRWLAIFLTGRHIPDLNSGLRVFRKSIALQFFHLLPSRFSFTITLTLACLTNDYPICYVPIEYKRRIGQSSIRPVQDTLQFFFLVFRIIMYFKPLRFFIPPSLVMLVVGTTYLFWGIAVKEDILDGAIMLLVVGFQILFTGFLAEIINRQKIR